MASTKKPITTSVVIQYQDLEFSQADCLKKAQSDFKKSNRGVELESLNIYIKPEEHKVYYVGNSDKIGSVDI